MNDSFDVEAWLHSRAWREQLFVPQLLGPERRLFHCDLGNTLISTLINGGQNHPKWTKEPGAAFTPTLFRALAVLVDKYGASWFLITDPDNAYSSIEWSATADGINEDTLRRLETSPTVEGGCIHLGLAFHRQECALVFELDPANSLRLSLYGSPSTTSKVLAVLGVTEED